MHVERQGLLLWIYLNYSTKFGILDLFISLPQCVSSQAIDIIKPFLADRKVRIGLMVGL